MIEGYVINNGGRSKYIFKQHVQSGAKVSLDVMYEKYKNKYQGEFDVGFLEWLEKNKVPVNFDIVVKSIDEVETSELSPAVKEEEVMAVEEITSELELDIHPDRKFNPSKMTPKEISELKIKDSPKNIISRVMSVHKLRRAYTLCKDRPGKGTLVKIIRQRITELK